MDNETIIHIVVSCAAFAIGFAASLLVRKFALGRVVAESRAARTAFNALMLSARDVLSDAFYKRLCRRFKERMGGEA